jgi:hypothetical protein
VIAINTLRQQPHYRRAAFDAGLQKFGYRLVSEGQPNSSKDVLLLWNRQGHDEGRAAAWEKRGGTVLVAENAYLEHAKNSMYAISVHGHNGSGRFPVGTHDRFQSLDVELQSWREGPGHILIAGQRGIGSRRMASPPQWELKTARTLKAMGHTKVVIRQHPGRYAPETTLEVDLKGAAVCVIWSSASGVKALTMGVPVVYCAPHWICEHAALHGLDHVAAPLRDDVRRRVAMHNMAFGQWQVDEIERGEPFARLMAMVRA